MEWQNFIETIQTESQTKKLFYTLFINSLKLIESSLKAKENY